SGPARARWFDPASGAYQDIGTELPNTGTRSFTTPGNNSAGAQDWVLVLDILTIVDVPLILSISESPPGTFIIESQAQVGRTYQFQYKNHLLETNWTILGADQTAVSSRVAITNSPDAVQRFY